MKRILVVGELESGRGQRGRERGNVRGAAPLLMMGVMSDIVRDWERNGVDAAMVVVRKLGAAG